MRRPTQHSARTPRGAWSHPYTGIDALAVFYNSGGSAPATGNPQTPATPPATFVEPQAAPPTPAAPPATGPGAAELVITQDQLSALATREKAQGERSGGRKALEKFAADNGFSTVEDAETFIKAARQAHEAALTEEQKRAAELDRREKELAAREAAAAKAQRDADQRSALVALGATGPELADALALLQAGLPADADADALTKAAEQLKARRPELFGTPQPPTPPLPPAPGGAPAAGPRPGGAVTKPGDFGREMLRRRGKLPDAA